jgi:hypothetical protein
MVRSCRCSSYFGVLLLLLLFGIVECVIAEEVLYVPPSRTPRHHLFWKKQSSNSDGYCSKFTKTVSTLIRHATVSAHTHYYSKSMSDSPSSPLSAAVATIPSVACSLGTGSVEKCSTRDSIQVVVTSNSTSSTGTTPLQPQQRAAAAAWKARTDTSITTSSEEDDAALPTTASTSNRRLAWLGGEPCCLQGNNEDAELASVEEMLQLLTLDERQAMPDGAMPIRHLRAEKGHVPRAVEKLRLALKWRREFQVDSLLASMNDQNCNDEAIDDDERSRREHHRNTMLQEADTGKIYIRGYTTDGRAIMYMRPARENTNHEDGNMKHLVWNLEKAIACTKRRSLEIIQSNNKSSSNSNVDDHTMHRRIQEPKEKVVLLIDYTNFKLSNAPPLSTSRLTLDILQKHYPERMQCAYLLHTPFFFNAFWTIIKPFIDPVTKEKIIFCNTAKGLQQLYNHVGGMENLEVSAGGTIPNTVPETFDAHAYLTMPFDESL